jgi:hypothetical protein
MRMAVVGTHDMSVLRITCDGNSWDHMRWQCWDPNVMPFVGTTYGCQFLGPHAMAI